MTRAKYSYNSGSFFLESILSPNYSLLRLKKWRNRLEIAWMFDWDTKKVGLTRYFFTKIQLLSRFFFPKKDFACELVTWHIFRLFSINLRADFVQFWDGNVCLSVKLRKTSKLGIVSSTKEKNIAGTKIRSLHLFLERSVGREDWS